MDKVNLDQAGRPLQIRSGHTPVNIGLLAGAVGGALPALCTAAARSGAVGKVLPLWAAIVFYGVLLLSSATVLAAIWRPLPTHLDDTTFRLIVRRLIMERVGLYGVSMIMLCFATATLVANGTTGLPGANMLGGIAIGLFFRARQTTVDVHKLHNAMEAGTAVTGRMVADPDGAT